LSSINFGHDELLRKSFNLKSKEISYYFIKTVSKTVARTSLYYVNGLKDIQILPCGFGKLAISLKGCKSGLSLAIYKGQVCYLD
jgi:hypothetical protein